MKIEFEYGSFETKIGDFKIEIETDKHAESPLEYEEKIKLACANQRYNLGNEEIDCSYGKDWKSSFMHHFADETGFIFTSEYEAFAYLNDRELKRIEKWVDANYVYLPLYLYDHSGITMSTEPFSCRWDSGQVGYAYLSKKEAAEVFGFKRFTKKNTEKVYKLLRCVVDNYDNYLRGECYQYSIKDSDDDIIESCGGFLGMDHKASGLAEYVNNEMSALAA